MQALACATNGLGDKTRPRTIIRNRRLLIGRSLAKLALTEDEIKAIDVPGSILIGEKDGPIKRLYVEPHQEVRSDWPAIEIKDANHINCILKPQFQDEIVAALKRHAASSMPK